MVKGCRGRSELNWTPTLIGLDWPQSNQRRGEMPVQARQQGESEGEDKKESEEKADGSRRGG